MSTTKTCTNKRLSRADSLTLVSPKKQRLDLEPERTPRAPTTAPATTSTLRTPSAQQIWSWTITEDAVAQCFIKDVYDMKDSGVKDFEFFWIGRIPCRTIVLIGIIVGVQPYEKRTIYTIDDGTSTLECIYTHPVATLPTIASPSKKNTKLKRPSDKEDPLAKYRAPLPAAKPQLAAPPALDLPTPPPLALAEVGQLVRLRGRVILWKERNGEQVKRVLIDSLVPCRSLNDEAKHWITVLDLHRTKYHNSALAPFLIPTTLGAKAPHSTLSSVTSTPSRDTSHIVDPSFTSSSVASSSVAPSSPVTSPSRVTSAGTPAKPKLRHPSRLHSRDLTENTFRIYVKHYMNNAPPPIPSLDYDSASDSEDAQDVLATPTKVRHSRPAHHHLDKATPRMSRGSPDRTPRAPAPPGTSKDTSTSNTLGFTLSYLRRIPELANLARRVVASEGKRRARQAKHAAALQDKSPHRNHRDNSASQAAKLLARAKAKAAEPPGPKMKRLFSMTIMKLYEEGAIVLWDGPARPLPKHDTPCASQGGRGLWKGEDASRTSEDSIFSLGPHSSQVLDHSNASSASSTSRMLRTLDDTHASEFGAEDDGGALSDPQANEDSYVPLTSALLAPHVECAVGTLVERARRQARIAPRNARQSEKGATKAAITAFLSRSDERWAKVDEWAVEDALSWLEGEGRVWRAGDSQWELCL